MTTMTPPVKTAHDEFKRGYKATFNRVQGTRKSAPWDQKTTNRHFRAGAFKMLEDLHHHVHAEKPDGRAEQNRSGDDDNFEFNDTAAHEAWKKHAREHGLNSRSPMTKGVEGADDGGLDALDETVYDAARQAVRVELEACGVLSLKALGFGDGTGEVNLLSLIRQAQQIRDAKNVPIDGLTDALMEKNTPTGVTPKTAARLQRGIECALEAARS